MWVEFISTLFSLLFLVIIISPALIILLDYDITIIPSFLIYSLGLQWAWQFNIVFLDSSIGFFSYCDHNLITSDIVINLKLTTNKSIINPHQIITDNTITKGINISWIQVKELRLVIGFILNKLVIGFHKLITTNKHIITRFLFDINQYIILPVYSFIRLLVISFDVIHTIGFYSWGIKIDAIPGRINLITTMRLIWKGEYRGKCFELCYSFSY